MNNHMNGDRDENALNSADEAFREDDNHYESDEGTAQRDPVDRDIESVNSGGRKSNILPLVVLVAIVALGIFVITRGEESAPEERVAEREQPTIQAGSRAPSLPPPPTLPEAPPQAEPAAPTRQIRTSELTPPPPAQTGEDPEAISPEMRRRQGGMLALSSGSSEESSSQTLQTSGQGQLGFGGNNGQSSGQLASMTTAERLSGERAQIIENRHMTITQGQMIPCALETAIDSSLPGFVSCRVTRDVMGTSGKVPLIDRGSKFIGQYQSGISIGDARLFVLWTRIETPEGVIINVDSPGGDSLGRAGHEGHVDSRFWARYGAAMVFSLFEDVSDYLVAEATQNRGSNTINLGNTSNQAGSASEMILEQYLDIPPILTKNQGGRINIFVARDLDFSGVYELANR